MGTTRAKVLNPLHLSLLRPAPPLAMTGLERGLSLCDLCDTFYRLHGKIPTTLYIVQLSTHAVGLYVKLISSHRAVQPKPSARSVRGGSGRTGRTRGLSRSEAGSTMVYKSNPLLLIDTEIPQRYQDMVWLAPLMTAAIPTPRFPAHRSHGPHFHSTSRDPRGRSCGRPGSR